MSVVFRIHLQLQPEHPIRGRRSSQILGCPTLAMIAVYPSFPHYCPYSSHLSGYGGDWWRWTIGGFRW